MKHIHLILSAAGALLFASCAAPVTSAEGEAMAKSFRPSPGKANVYLYRTWFGTQIDNNLSKEHIDIDGRKAGFGPALHQFTLLQDVSPGEHTLTAYKGEKFGVKVGAATHKFSTSAGENVFLKITPLYGIGIAVFHTPCVRFNPIPDSEGKELTLKSTMTSDPVIVD